MLPAPISDHRTPVHGSQRFSSASHTPAASKAAAPGLRMVPGAQPHRSPSGIGIGSCPTGQKAVTLTVGPSCSAPRKTVRLQLPRAGGATWLGLGLGVAGVGVGVCSGLAGRAGGGTSTKYRAPLIKVTAGVALRNGLAGAPSRWRRLATFLRGSAVAGWSVGKPSRSQSEKGTLALHSK
jgi:hypothetical protein